MKRMWIGIALLLVLLVYGLLTAWFMERAQEPVIRELSQAAQAALSADWSRAARLTARAQAMWESNWQTVAALADHTPMEEIDSLFSELQIYLTTQEDVHFAATCARLCQLTGDIGDAHSLSWWNLA